MDLQLTGLTALVSGSHRGTGEVIAQELAREGAKVLVHGFDQPQAEAALESWKLESAAVPVSAVPVSGDITTDAGAEDLFRACEPFALDVLVNNYGTAGPGSWSESDSSDWIDSYQRNVLSAVRLVRHFLPGMKTRGFGRILNLGTIGSTSPNSRMPHYYSAKGALATMTASLAKEVGASGVRVNLVSPGLIRTPEVEAHYLAIGRRKGWGETWEEIEANVARDTTIGRIATRQEIASLIAFLASPLADSIHGQNIRVDGGSLGIV